jgi:hypothetical protein
MRYVDALIRLAAECEQRANEARSAGDRGQLILIARQLRAIATRQARRRAPLRLVVDAPATPLA